ncbi:prestin-like isoform X2 [Pleurodeles waltl]|uniref:prestin-like isoform X2 n=1 Tax=Pleurodeles waltl TaxID=8319 RepID=UPI003709AAEB
MAFGLAIALLFSILTICIRTHSTKIQLIGQIPETNIYRNFLEYPETLEVTGVKIFQCCSSIYFANMRAFLEHLVKMAGLDPEVSEARRLQTSVKRNEADRSESETKCALMDYCTLCIQSQIYHTGCTMYWRTPSTSGKGQQRVSGCLAVCFYYRDG